MSETKRQRQTHTTCVECNKTFQRKAQLLEHYNTNTHKRMAEVREHMRADKSSMSSDAADRAAAGVGDQPAAPEPERGTQDALYDDGPATPFDDQLPQEQEQRDELGMSSKNDGNVNAHIDSNDESMGHDDPGYPVDAQGRILFDGQEDAQDDDDDYENVLEDEDDDDGLEDADADEDSDNQDSDNNSGSSSSSSDAPPSSSPPSSSGSDDDDDEEGTLYFNLFISSFFLKDFLFLLQTSERAAPGSRSSREWSTFSS